MSQQDEIAQLRSLIAELTGRVYALERTLALQQPADASPVVQLATPVPITTAQTAPPPGTPPVNVAGVTQPPIRFPVQGTFGQDVDAGPSRQSSLESRIGSQWLNRIGIIATLVGISYFLKYAFENNWIGPGGRIAIGLLSGLAIVLSSERFRTKGH